MSDAAHKLAVQAHAHIVEEVQKNLHSSREKYLKELSPPQEESPGVWKIVLGKKALWIEEGLEEHEMIDDLLKSSKAKTSSDGSKYLSVPFEHNKGPTSQTPEAKSLTDAIKKSMKSQGAPWAKMETDAQGNIKTGKVRSFDILTQPIKTKEGPGMGHGPIGAVRQGMTGIPFLKGVQVSQKPGKDPKGKDIMVKSVSTFRTVSSKQKGSGMWVHPGFEAKHFFEKAEEWVKKEFAKIEEEVLVDVIKKLK